MAKKPEYKSNRSNIVTNSIKILNKIEDFSRAALIKIPLAIYFIISLWISYAIERLKSFLECRKFCVNHKSQFWSMAPSLETRCHLILCFFVAHYVVLGDQGYTFTIPFDQIMLTRYVLHILLIPTKRVYTTSSFTLYHSFIWYTIFSCGQASNMLLLLLSRFSHVQLCATP